MTSTLEDEESSPVHEGTAAAAEGPVLRALYDAAEPLPGDE